MDRAISTVWVADTTTVGVKVADTTDVGFCVRFNSVVAVKADVLVICPCGDTS